MGNRSGYKGYGIGQHFGTYPLLFSARTTKNTVAMLDGIDYAGKGVVYGIADMHGDAVIVEKIGIAQGVEWLKPGCGALSGQTIM